MPYLISVTKKHIMYHRSICSVIFLPNLSAFLKNENKQCIQIDKKQLSFGSEVGGSKDSD